MINDENTQYWLLHDVFEKGNLKLYSSTGLFLNFNQIFYVHS
jgi:hypothetical protein